MDKLKLSGSMPNIEKDGFWENALRISEQRLSVLASNIANADTPNYKARDIDFRSALQQAMAVAPSLSTSVKVTGTATKESPFVATLLYRLPTQGSVDGNTVDMDTERAAFAEQAIRQEFLFKQAIDEYKDIGDLFNKMVR